MENYLYDDSNDTNDNNQNIQINSENENENENEDKNENENENETKLIFDRANSKKTIKRPTVLIFAPKTLLLK